MCRKLNHKHVLGYRQARLFKRAMVRTFEQNYDLVANLLTYIALSDVLFLADQLSRSLTMPRERPD